MIPTIILICCVLLVIISIVVLIKNSSKIKDTVEDNALNKDENQELDDELQHVKASVWKKIFKLVLKKKTDIVVMIISVLILACLDVYTPMLNSQIIKVFFGENPDFTQKWKYIIIYIGISVAYFIVIYSFIKRAALVEARVGYEIRKETFFKLQELPFSYYDRTPSGWIMARVTSDSRKLSEIVSWSIVDFLWAFFTMIGVIIMMFKTHVVLALIVCIVIPFMIVISFVLMRVILKAYRNVRKVNSLITGTFNESILGAKTTKTLCLETKRSTEFENLTAKMKRMSLKAIIKDSILWPLILVLGYVSVSLTLNVGGGLVLGTIGKQKITVDVLYLFISYALLFFDPVMNISRVISELQQAEASAERIVDLIETDVAIKDTEEVVKKYGTLFKPIRENFEELQGDIEFKNVVFGYKNKGIVLKNFNLKVKKGMSVALVGPTGAGKSTIINLLCRFYEPNSGEILIDGKNYKERSLTWLHENLGYVLQTPHLFNGTIKENIAYGKPNASDDEIVNAAKAAQAYDFIIKLPDKFETKVGEGGSKLSLGERQLISFARAILINPKILILDEATSSIDTQTEVKIKDIINNFMKGRTTFMVAHRLSTVVNSDLILVIADGEIKEQGNHRELLDRKGIYYNLYKNQFIDENLENSMK